MLKRLFLILSIAISSNAIASTNGGYMACVATKGAPEKLVVSSFQGFHFMDVNSFACTNKEKFMKASWGSNSFGVRVRVQGNLAKYIDFYMPDSMREKLSTDNIRMRVEHMSYGGNQVKILQAVVEFTNETTGETKRIRDEKRWENHSGGVT